MLAINLLPWRKEKAKKEFREVKELFVMTIIMSLIILTIAHYILIFKQQQSQEVVRSLQHKIDHLQAHLLSASQSSPVTDNRMKMIKQWRDAQHRFLLLIQRLSMQHDLPICFTQMMQQGSHLIFNGIVQSSHVLTQFLLTWPALDLFSEIHIDSITPHDANFFFQLRATPHPLST